MHPACSAALSLPKLGATAGTPPVRDLAGRTAMPKDIGVRYDSA